jgi:ferritin-like metal-binding protein YciE
MTAAALRDLYLAELNDLYDAEQQVLRELPLFAAGATSAELREAFDGHYRQTQQHVARLDRLFASLDERPRPVSGHGLRGIIEDARRRHGHLEPGDVLDAALIAAARQIGHYEIAAYQAAHAHALSLSDADGAEMLQETLDEEGGMQQRLAQLAAVGSLLTANGREPTPTSR